MPRKDPEASKAAQRIAEDLKRLANPDHPVRKISLANLPDNLGENHPLRKMGRDARRLAELRERQQRELAAKKRAKKKTRPPVEIPHLDEALAALDLVRTEDRSLRDSPKAAAGWVMKFLAKHGSKVPESQQRTIERRIAGRDKSPPRDLSSRQIPHLRSVKRISSITKQGS
jgi:hypothetical protein